MCGRTVHVYRQVPRTRLSWQVPCSSGRYGMCAVTAFGVRLSDGTHRRADLHQSIQIPSLIRAEERAIVRVIQAQEARPSFAPGIPGNRYWVERRQHPALTQTRFGIRIASHTPYPARSLPCKMRPFRYATDSRCRMGIVRPTVRTADGSNMLGGHLCGRSEHNYRT
jgi:hypothetical protein